MTYLLYLGPRLKWKNNAIQNETITIGIEMKITIAFVLNVAICIIYLLGMSLINRLAPLLHPNVAYGLAMIVCAGILFTIQILLLLLLLFWSRNKFIFFIPLIIPCAYELSILEVYPKRSLVWLLMLLILYTCYYLFLMKYVLPDNRHS